MTLGGWRIGAEKNSCHKWQGFFSVAGPEVQHIWWRHPILGHDSLTKSGMRHDLGENGAGTVDILNLLWLVALNFLIKLKGKKLGPKSGGEGGADEQGLFCSKWKEGGHINKDCRKNVYCILCGKESHLTEDCGWLKQIKHVAKYVGFAARGLGSLLYRTLRILTTLSMPILCL